MQAFNGNGFEYVFGCEPQLPRPNNVSVFVGNGDNGVAASNLILVDGEVEPCRVVVVAIGEVVFLVGIELNSANGIRPNNLCH